MHDIPEVPEVSLDSLIYEALPTHPANIYDLVCKALISNNYIQASGENPRWMCLPQDTSATECGTGALNFFESIISAIIDSHNLESGLAFQIARTSVPLDTPEVTLDPDDPDQFRLVNLLRFG